jgi:mRNA interferase MazF
LARPVTPVIKFSKRDVVVVPFPFSDLTGDKRRPALVVAQLQGDDLILCQITTKTNRDKYAIALERSDFEAGSLPEPSCSIRPNRLFTAEKSLIIRKAGKLKTEKMDEVIAGLVAILQS